MRAVLLLAVALAAAGCTADARPESTVVSTSTVADATSAVPLIDLIDDAVAAIEGEFGAELDYFEINATRRLVNLFVALNDGEVVQPWVYLDGELSFAEGSPATGGTFRAADLDFDRATVLSTLQAELPGSTIETFFVNGDGAGHVQYGALVTSSAGGGLEVRLGPDGAVLSVDPVD